MSKYILFALVILTLAIPYNVFADSSKVEQLSIPVISIEQGNGYFSTKTEDVQASSEFIVDNRSYSVGDEIIEKRTENSKTVYLGKVGKYDKFAVDISIDAIHYKDNYADDNEQWKDIDLTIINGKMDKAPYELTINGNMVTMRDKKTNSITNLILSSIDSKSITLPKLSETKGKAFAANIATDTDLEVSLDNTKVRFTRILKSDKAPTECMFGITQTGTGITLTSEAKDSRISGDNVIPITATRLGTVLIEDIDKSKGKFTYPIRIDPTLNIDPTSSTDDADVTPATTTINIVKQDPIIGKGAGNPDVTLQRFNLVTIPNGSNITTSYLVLTSKYNTSGGTVKTDIYGEQNNNSANFTTYANYAARTLTTAKVDWDFTTNWTTDSTYNTGDIKTIIQELVDDYSGLLSANISIFIFDDGSAAMAYRQYNSYDGSVAKSEKLHIEYTQQSIISTLSASSVEETSATMGGNVTYYGGANITEYGIQYGNVTGYGSWQNVTEVKTSEFSFSNSTVGLNQGDKYYFRAFCNDIVYGYTYGSQLTFITKPNEPNTLAIGGGDYQSINVSWVKGTGANTTVVVYKDGGYPANIADGTIGYNGTSTGYTQAGLSTDHTYYFRAWSWASDGGLSVYSDTYDEAFMFRTADIPSINTATASSVTTTSARLNANVISDGGAPTGVIVRFGYSNVTHPATFTDYATDGIITSWSAANYTTAQLPWVDVAGLHDNMTYYFNVNALNSGGNSTGTQISFTTVYQNVTSAPIYFSGVPASTSISLQWTKTGDASYVKLYYQQSAIPTDNTTGILLYSGSDNYFPHTGLTPGTSYGYRIYGYEAGIWSTNSTTLMVTTLPAATIPTGVPHPTTPSSLFITPNSSYLSNIPFHELIDSNAAAIGMPVGNFYLIMFIMAGVVVGFLIYNKGKDEIVSLVAMGAIFGFGTSAQVVPLWITIGTFLLVIPIWAIKRRA
jgi:hypothetical protein